MKFLGLPSSGSIAGTTFSHNRAGQYTRSRRTPVNPVGTGRRAIVRAHFSAAAKGYAALTAPLQALWLAYAISYPVIDALGQSIKLTAQQIFIAIAASCANVAAAAPTVPPLTNAVTAPGLTVSTFVHTTGILTMTLDGSGSASDYICIAFSRPKTSGTGFCKTFWQQLVVPASSVGAATYGTAYIAQFGTPAVGQRVFYRLTPVNQYGVTGTPVIGFITVTQTLSEIDLSYDEDASTLSWTFVGGPPAFVYVWGQIVGDGFYTQIYELPGAGPQTTSVPVWDEYILSSGNVGGVPSGVVSNGVS